MMYTSNIQHMHRKRSTQQKGFLELIVIVLIALILLRFLNIDVKAVLAKEWVQDFIRYVKDVLVLVWQDAISIFKSIKGA